MRRILFYSLGSLLLLAALAAIYWYRTDYPKQLTNQVIKLYQAGKYAEALPVARRSLELREKTLGHEHPEVAVSLNNLAELYRALDDYALAESLYQRALSIWEKSLGPQDGTLAQGLTNLAGLYTSMGEYAKAEPLFKRALSIWEKSSGPETLDVGRGLAGLAALYYFMGVYAKAEPLYLQSLALLEKFHGPDHPGVAAALNNLAMLYHAMGANDKVLSTYERSFGIRVKNLGPEHPDVAQSLNNIAWFYASTSQYAKALPLYQRALSIWEKSLGPDNINVAISLHNMADVYCAMDKYEQAESLYLRGLAIGEKTLGPQHQLMAKGLYNLARMQAAKGDDSQALALMQRAERIQAGLIDQVMSFTNESQKLDYLLMLRADLQMYLSFVSQRLGTDKSAVLSAFEVWLRRKGAALEAQRQFQQALVLSGDAKGREVFEHLARLRTEFTQMLYAGPDKDHPETFRSQLDELNKQQAELQAELSRLSQSYARGRKRREADAAQAAAALPPKTALVELAKIERYDFSAREAQKRWLPAHYLAFILPAGAPDRLALLDLGEAQAVDKAVAAFKRGLAPRQYSETSRKAAHELYDRVFAPLVPLLDTVTKIFLSPDGELNLIPFEVLLDRQDRPLIEKYEFNYLGAGRDLVGMGEMQTADGPALVVGDPDFNSAAASSQSSNKTTHHPEQDPAAFQRSADLRGLTFASLPATRVEAKAVADLLGPNAQLFLGAEAVEEALQRSPSPRYVHLATHGFFLTDQQFQSVVNARGAEGAPPALAAMPPRPVPARHYEDPLCRSGIALAGANMALRGKGTEGIVTAEKFLSLPLHGTEIVTLSACQTGLGDISSGEGVFGLRRAIIQAGAKGMVMSLWSVPDTETQELMQAFYENILQGMSKAQALRQAALQEREIVRERYRADNPFFWGAFVYLGEK
jgi:CHAT domain-containing protein/tetratricopeptide (TPR) repeat protein